MRTLNISADECGPISNRWKSMSSKIVISPVHSGWFALDMDCLPTQKCYNSTHQPAHDTSLWLNNIINENKEPVGWVHHVMLTLCVHVSVCAYWKNVITRNHKLDKLPWLQIMTNLFIFAMKGKTTSRICTVLPTMSKALYTLIWLKQIFSLSL